MSHNEAMEAINEFADAIFKACDNEGPSQFICTLENGPDTNTILHSRLSVRLRLKRGITFEQAERITNYLNDHIDGIAVTEC